MQRSFGLQKKVLFEQQRCFRESHILDISVSQFTLRKVDRKEGFCGLFSVEQMDDCRTVAQPS